MQITEPTEISYRVKFYQNRTSDLQAIGNNLVYKATKMALGDKE